jgi:hypothetical protein
MPGRVASRVHGQKSDSMASGSEAGGASSAILGAITAGLPQFAFANIISADSLGRKAVRTERAAGPGDMAAAKLAILSQLSV